MNKIFFSLCLLAAYGYGPGQLSAQESLLVRTIKGNAGIIYAIAYSPDGKHIASGGVDTAIKIWNVDDGSLARSFPGHRSFINALAYSPDGKTLVSASEDGMIKIWDAETGKCWRTVKGHNDAASALVFFPDGARFASAGGDGMIRLWRLNSKKPYKAINTQSGYVYSVAVSSDGSRLASGAADRNIKLWNADTGARLMTFEGHVDSVNSVAFNKVANYLASASDDSLVKVWRLSDGMCIKTFSGQQRPFYAVSYSPDASYIFAAGGDKLVSAWRVADAMQARTFSGHGGQIKSLSLSPDGKYMISGSYDKTIKLWLTPWEADRRDKEMKDNDAREVEKNRNYDQRYAAGNELLSKPTKANLTKAVNEFTLALTFKSTEACEKKLAEAKAALKQKEEEWQRNLKLGLQGGAALAVLLVIILVFGKARKKAKMRATLPLEIRNETLAGNYERAMKYYNDYKAVGGDPKKLPRVEMMELFRGLQALSDLPKENLPYEYLLSYASTIVQEGNHKLAFTMLRSGRLLDEFRSPAEFDTFAEIFIKAGRPEMLFAAKLTPAAYSSLAEALFKANDHENCGKACSLKKQFYADKMSPRDSELLAACQKKSAELAEARKNAKLKWRCINCGQVVEGDLAPESCPGCMHPREHFQLVDK